MCVAAAEDCTVSNEGRAMQLPTINWSFNAYTILTVIGATAMNYAVMSYRVEANERELAKVKSSVSEIDKAANQFVLNDANFTVRLNNTIDGLQEVRRVANEQALLQSKTNGEVLAQLSAIRETLAWFRATLENNGAPRQPRQQGAP